MTRRQNASDDHKKFASSF